MVDMCRHTDKLRRFGAGQTSKLFQALSGGDSGVSWWRIRVYPHDDDAHDRSELPSRALEIRHSISTSAHSAKHTDSMETKECCKIEFENGKRRHLVLFTTQQKMKERRREPARHFKELSDT